MKQNLNVSSSASGVIMPKKGYELRKLLKTKAGLRHVRQFIAIFKRKNESGRFTGRLEPAASPVMRQMSRSGLSQVEIARVWEISSSAVHQRLNW
jgi:hypothetical protein